MDAMEIAISLVGVGLTIMGTAFTAWAIKLKEVMEIATKIDTRLIELARDFHNHQVHIERRLSHVESRVNGAEA